MIDKDGFIRTFKDNYLDVIGKTRSLDTLIENILDYAEELNDPEEAFVFLKAMFKYLYIDDEVEDFIDET